MRIDRLMSRQLVWLALATVLGGPGALVRAASPAEADKLFHDQLLPLVETYCIDCHGDSDDPAGGFSLAAYKSAEHLQHARKAWLRALQQVQIGSMPPPDGPSLDDQTRQKLAGLIDELANAVDCVRAPNPGLVVMRRLTRYEYRNTVRDLTGIDYELAASFPADDVGYGFDNIGDVLSLPPILLEKYLTAAEEISRNAIVVPEGDEQFAVQQVGWSLEGASRFSKGPSNSVAMNSNGSVTLEVQTPFAGMYKLTVTASADLAGSEPPKLEVRVNGKKQKLLLLEQKDATAYELPIRLGIGRKKIEFAFINDYFKDGQDRNIRLHHVRVEGERPSKALDDTQLPEAHRRIVFVRPSDDGLSVDEATDKVLERLVSRAFRRPARPEELKRLAGLARQVRDDGMPYEAGLQVALQAILVSPHFLYKVELPSSSGRTDAKAESISDFELATRLSYFIWGSMPDDELLLHAWRGTLRQGNNLHEQTARLLADKRSNALIENFAEQWLQLRNLDRTKLDPKRFPKFNDNIRQLMRRETLTFFAAVARRDLPVTALLNGKFTYVNDELANYYGLPGVEGDHFRPVSLEGTPRGGLLTQGSVLVVTSNPTRTSPVKRGKWIMDNVLGTPPPPAPPNVPELDKAELTGTLRERMEQHRVDPACASCHKVMDPLGFALEQFDAAGRYRDSDEHGPVDAAGELPDGTRFVGAGELRSSLLETRRSQFVRCVTEKLLTFALGRGLEYYDRCAVDQMISELQQEDLRFSALVQAIVASDPFQKRGVR